MIEHPLTTDEQRVKFRAGYDQIADEIEKYKIRTILQEMPEMRAVFEAQGRIRKENR